LGHISSSRFEEKQVFHTVKIHNGITISQSVLDDYGSSCVLLNFKLIRHVSISESGKKDLSEKVLVGLKPIHIFLLISAQACLSAVTAPFFQCFLNRLGIVQIAIIVAVQQSVVHEAFPKLPAPPPYPAAGQVT
jgi:hypothetical protein